MGVKTIGRIDIYSEAKHILGTSGYCVQIWGIEDQRQLESFDYLKREGDQIAAKSPGIENFAFNRFFA